MDRPAFYHDLQCRSGLGDRLLDLWAVGTVAALHEPNGLLAFCWHEGFQFATFVGTYSTDLFKVARCRFVGVPPYGAFAMEGYFSHIALNQRGIVRLGADVRQLILRTGMIWGNTCPERLHADLAFYELDPRIPPERVVDIYRGVAASTAPLPSIVSAAPEDIETRVGIHIRLGDKLVMNETSTDMSLLTWRSIERDAVAYMEQCIDRGEPLFVCSDDPVYKAALIDHLRSKGGDVVTVATDLDPHKVPGNPALVDFFALSRCTRIVQMTKYSTFSLAAALVGDVPLVNFYRDESGVGHRLDIWRSALRQVGSV